MAVPRSVPMLPISPTDEPDPPKRRPPTTMQAPTLSPMRAATKFVARVSCCPAFATTRNNTARCLPSAHLAIIYSVTL